MKMSDLVVGMGVEFEFAPSCWKRAVVVRLDCYMMVTLRYILQTGEEITGDHPVNKIRRIES